MQLRRPQVGNDSRQAGSGDTRWWTSERLQLDPDLTLEKAKKAIRQREAVQQQQQVLKGTGKPSSLEALHYDRRTKRQRGSQQQCGTQYSGNRAKQYSTPHSGTKACTRFGKGTHPRNKCPAKDATCHRCQSKGHYGAMCYAKTVKTAAAVMGEASTDTAFLDTMTSGCANTWFTPIHQETLFKLDTGTEVTAISVDTYQHIGKPQLHTPDKILYGPSRQPLQVLGQFLGSLAYKAKQSQQQVFVVKGLQTNLLGLPAITALNLAARVNTTLSSEADICQRFPKVFEVLGNLGDEFEIKLKPDAVPYSLFTPRHVPLPLRPKVEQELTRMESMGVISRVDEPTPWCAGMVVVPKKSGSIHICVDLKPLNESVLREVHPLPKVDETLAQLMGAKVFSKLDANSGFWQIPLSEPSRLLTTFIAPICRYCFNKLPFGIFSAPEHFQKRMSRIFSGLDGVLCQMDDVLIFGMDQAEHDARLTAAFKCIEMAGATLNPDKCEF